MEGVVYVFWALSSEKKRQNVVVSDEIYSSLVVFFICMKFKFISENSELTLRYKSLGSV